MQVIVLELYMDLGASTSFVAEPAEAGVMARPPRRPTDKFFDAVMVARIVAGGVSMAGCVLAGYAWGLHNTSEDGGDAVGSSLGADVPLQRAQSMAFVCWLMGHVLLAVNQRTGDHREGRHHQPGAAPVGAVGGGVGGVGGHRARAGHRAGVTGPGCRGLGRRGCSVRRLHVLDGGGEAGRVVLSLPPTIE